MTFLQSVSQSKSDTSSSVYDALIEVLSVIDDQAEVTSLLDTVLARRKSADSSPAWSLVNRLYLFVQDESADVIRLILKFPTDFIFRFLLDEQIHVRESAIRATQAIFKGIETKLKKSMMPIELTEVDAPRLTALTDRTLLFIREMKETDSYFGTKSDVDRRRDPSRNRISTLIQFTKWLLIATNRLNDETWPILLHFRELLVAHQTEDADCDAFRVLRLLCSYPFALVNSQFATFYSATMSKFGAHSRQLLKGFHSFKHYLPHLTLADILTILNHPSFKTIRNILPTANVNGKSNSLAVFIDRLLFYRNEHELVKQSLLMLLDFDYRLDVPCIDLYVRLLSAMTDDLPSDLLSRMVTFVSSSLTVRNVRLVTSFAKVLLEKSKIYDLSGLLQSILDSIGSARAHTVREPIIDCLSFIIRTRGRSFQDAILSSAYRLIATSRDIPTAENITVVTCSIIVKSGGNHALIATMLHSLYAQCRTRPDLASFGLFQPLTRLLEENPENDWGKMFVFLLLDPVLSAFPRGHPQSFLQTVVNQFTVDEAAAFLSIVRPTTSSDWGIVSSLFGRLQDGHDRLRDAFRVKERPSPVGADIAASVATIFGDSSSDYGNTSDEAGADSEDDIDEPESKGMYRTSHTY
jgi:hypothetical protein